MNARATPFHTRRFISGINTKFSRAAYTKIEICHIQAHEVCRIHACTILHLHTYCIYIYYLAAHIRHVYSIHTAYVHTCTCYTCMLHTQYIHIACMCVHKNWFSTIRMPYKHMKKCMQFVCNCLHAACMLYINNCMYAAHNNRTHLAYIYSDVCDLMCMYVACVWR